MFIKCPKQDIALLFGLVRLCNTPPSFKRYVMEPNVFLGYLVRGIAYVLSRLGHEQYPSNNVDPLCLNYKIQLTRVLVSLSIFIGLRNTPPHVKIYVMEFNVFIGYPKRGIACLVNPYGHEQYPSNNLDQNNSAHDVIV